MKILQFTKPYLVEHRGKYLANIAIRFILWLLSLITPYSMGSYLDSLLTQHDDWLLWSAVLYFIFIWTIQLVFSYLKNLILSILNSKICFRIKMDVLSHISRLPATYMSNKNHAYLNQRINSDAQEITKYVLYDIESCMTCFLTIGLAGSIIATKSLGVFAIICSFLPLYVLIYCFFRKSIYNLNYKYSEEYGTLYSMMDRFLANIKLIKLQEWNKRFFSAISKAYNHLYKTTLLNANLGYVLSNLDSIIRYLIKIAVFIFSSYSILKDKMSVGEFTMLNSYSLMIVSSTSGILYFAKVRQQTVVAL